MATSDAFYVLVASDAEDQYGRRISGFEVWKRRFHRGVWPLYGRTPNAKSIREGDRVLFYVGGTGAVRQAFVGEAVVDHIVQWDRRKGEIDPETWLTTAAASALKMSELRPFRSPVKMASILDRLECAPANKSRWGVIVHGGVRKFSNADGTLVLGAANAGARAGM